MAGMIQDNNAPLLKNNFLLRVDAIYDIPCVNISGIKNTKEYQTIQSGGVNDYVYLRPKPASKQESFKVTRYIGKGFFDPLKVGKTTSIPIVLYVSRYQNDFELPKMTFTFWGCTVTAKEYGELDAQKSGLMTETTTISYQKMVVLTDSESQVESDWSFDMSGRRYQGSGKRHAVYDKNEVRKKEMESMTRTWPEQKSARTLPKFK